MKNIVLGLLVLVGVVAFSVSVMAQSEPKDSSSSQTTSVSSSYAVQVDNAGDGSNLPPCHSNLQSGQDPSNQRPQDGGNAYPRAGGGCCGGGGATSGADNVVY